MEDLLPRLHDAGLIAVGDPVDYSNRRLGEICEYRDTIGIRFPVVKRRLVTTMDKRRQDASLEPPFLDPASFGRRCEEIVLNLPKDSIEGSDNFVLNLSIAQETMEALIEDLLVREEEEESGAAIRARVGRVGRSSSAASVDHVQRSIDDEHAAQLLLMQDKQDTLKDEIQATRKELDDARKTLADTKDTLAEAQQRISDLEAESQVKYSRSEVEEMSERIRARVKTLKQTIREMHEQQSRGDQGKDQPDDVIEQYKKRLAEMSRLHDEDIARMRADHQEQVKRLEDAAEAATTARAEVTARARERLAEQAQTLAEANEDLHMEQVARRKLEKTIRALEASVKGKDGEIKKAQVTIQQLQQQLESLNAAQASSSNTADSTPVAGQGPATSIPPTTAASATADTTTPDKPAESAEPPKDPAITLEKAEDILARYSSATPIEVPKPEPKPQPQSQSQSQSQVLHSPATPPVAASGGGSSTPANTANNGVPRHRTVSSTLAAPRELVDDAEVEACMECSAQFTLFRRRHHCRFCGRVLCDDCTSKIVHQFVKLRLGSRTKIIRHRACNNCYHACRGQIGSTRPTAEGNSPCPPAQPSPSPHQPASQTAPGQTSVVLPSAPPAPAPAPTPTAPQQQQQQQPIATKATATAGQAPAAGKSVSTNPFDDPPASTNPFDDDEPDPPPVSAGPGTGAAVTIEDAITDAK